MCQQSVPPCAQGKRLYVPHVPFLPPPLQNIPIHTLHLSQSYLPSSSSHSPPLLILLSFTPPPLITHSPIPLQSLSLLHRHPLLTLSPIHPPLFTPSLLHSSPIHPFTLLPTDLSPELIRTLSRMMHPDPSLRYVL